MGLNTHLMLEEHALEQEIARLEGYGDDVGVEREGGWQAFEGAALLKQHLAGLRKVRHDYNWFLDGVADGRPTPGVSPRFHDHAEAFERMIQGADAKPA
jgi:hypothetical protein